jgi:hypothetical protein
VALSQLPPRPAGARPPGVHQSFGGLDVEDLVLLSRRYDVLLL